VKHTFVDYIAFLLPYFFIFIVIWITIYFFYKFLKNRKNYNALNFFERIKFKNKYGIDLYEREEKRRKKISGFEKESETFLKEIKKISKLILEKENTFRLSPAQAILFVELFNGKILKSDKGKYYIISDLDLKNFIKQINNQKITKDDVEKKLSIIEEYFIPKGKPEVNAEELFYMLRTNQIPNFKDENIFDFSHIDSIEENIINNFIIEDDEKVKSKVKTISKNDKQENELETNIEHKDFLEVKVKDKVIVYDLQDGIGGMYIKKKEKKDNKENKKDNMTNSLEELTNTIEKFMLNQQQIKKDEILLITKELIKVIDSSKKNNDDIDIEKNIKNAIENETNPAMKNAWKIVGKNKDEVTNALKQLNISIPEKVEHLSKKENKKEIQRNKNIEENKKDTTKIKETKDKEKKQPENKLENNSNENKIEEDEEFEKDYGNILSDFDEFDSIEEKKQPENKLEKNEKNELTEISNKNLNKEDNFFNQNIQELFYNNKIFKSDDIDFFKKEFEDFLECFKESDFIFINKRENKENILINKELLLVTICFVFYKKIDRVLLSKNFDNFLEFILSIDNKNKLVFNFIKNLNIIYNRIIKNNKAITIYLPEQNKTQEVYVITKNIFKNLKLKTDIFYQESKKNNTKKIELNDIISFIKDKKVECAF